MLPPGTAWYPTQIPEDFALKRANRSREPALPLADGGFGFRGQCQLAGSEQVFRSNTPGDDTWDAIDILMELGRSNRKSPLEPRCRFGQRR